MSVTVEQYERSVLCDAVMDRQQNLAISVASVGEESGDGGVIWRPRRELPALPSLPE